MTKEMSPKVFVVHDGNQEYLAYCLKSSTEYGHETILIGDHHEFGRHYSTFLTSKIGLPKFEKFKLQYRHLSSNPYDFELNCFRRFYLLELYVKKLGINEFWMIDSDVLLVDNLYKTQMRLLQDGYVGALSTEIQKNHFTMASCPHISFWTLRALSDFIDFLDRFYIDYLAVLEAKYMYQQGNDLQGGVCDMTALYLWSRSQKIFNTSSAYLNNFPFFDHQINQNTNYGDDELDFLTTVNLKKVVFRNKFNYVFSKKLGSYVQVACLHFQGGSKVYMGRFMQNRSITFFTEFFGVMYIRLARIKGGIKSALQVWST